MKPTSILAVCVLASLALATRAALAANQIDVGKKEYEASCAACHGQDGKGKGSFAELLNVSMPDLTTLSKRNGGVFPAVRVYDVIDGRAAVKAHGTREMPIWGAHFAFRSAPEHDDYPHESEAFVRARILTLIDYLYRLQVK
jgi:mono/diheme cytochrome c family protein